MSVPPSSSVPDPAAQLAAAREFNVKLENLNQRWAQLHREIIALLKNCPYDGDFVARVLADCGISQGEFLMMSETANAPANLASN